MDEQQNNPGGDWKWGMFYFNPKDSRIVVPKRAGLGWTLNFGHRISFFIMGLFFAFILGFVIYSSGLVKF